MPLAYHNGHFVDKNSLTLSPFDYGFNRSIAVYELVRVYGGVPFCLEEHLDRFDHSAQVLGINCSTERDDMLDAVEKLCAQNQYPHSVIKIFLTIGECAQPGAGFGDSSGFAPQLMIVEDEMHPLHPEAPKGLEIYKRGVAIKTVPFARDMPTVKSTNYTAGFVASRELGPQGWDDILFVHKDGYITEAATSNVFCVIDGVLCTPSRGMLFGITRKTLLELAKKLGIPTAERDIMPADLARASEAFITGSYSELVPVRKIDDVTFVVTMDGPVFSRLRQAYTAAIADACYPLAQAS
ncbi:MAG: aminotransferase class IV [Alphaproteobacteria bacterium]|nr:aminotransferase class IV [Alphaproteobacteria bacterium]